MYDARTLKLAAPLAQNASVDYTTQPLKKIDALEMVPNGHKLLAADGTLWKQEDGDFEVTVTNNGDGTFTWRDATPLPAGTYILGLANLDAIVDSDVAGGGGGGTVDVSGIGEVDDVAAVSGNVDATMIALGKGILNALLTQPASVPAEALLTATDLTNEKKSRNGVGEVQLVAAGAAGVTHRVHMYSITVPAAGTFEIRNGAAGPALRKHVFPDKGGIERGFMARPYAKTSAATALMGYWSGTGQAEIEFDFVSSAA